MMEASVEKTELGGSLFYSYSHSADGEMEIEEDLVETKEALQFMKDMS
jgi:hypothetical protein